MCAGTVGAVFCIEASHLARNGRDWHHLIDLCALVVDPDETYDPRIDLPHPAYPRVAQRRADRLRLGEPSRKNRSDVASTRINSA